MPHDQSRSRGGREECLVEVTVETQLLTVWGSATAPEAALMVDCGAPGHKEEVTRKIATYAGAERARGPRGLCALGQAILFMRGRHLRLRGGEEKGQHTMKAESQSPAVGFVAGTCVLFVYTFRAGISAM